MKRNIIIGTNNFGLGPVGKVSFIVTGLSDEYSFFACGNEFDLNIFKDGTFKDTLFSKDKEKIANFIKKHKINYAIVVLDVELATILMDLNVKVIFVDSLPFMWTQADIDEGLLPLDATVYCAQKCCNLTEASKKVLAQVKNLKWINPIQSKFEKKYRPYKEEYIHINVGGLHSPIGNGESYIKTVIIPLLNIFKSEKIIITCGTTAKISILNELKNEGIDSRNIKVETLQQKDFISSINNAKLFLTSPGLTTIYETESLHKPTIILPPQNLSQFYNIEYAKKILDEYKTINWDTQKLNLDYLQSILPKGETYVVDKIYEFITELVNSNFENKFIEQFNLILKQDYKKKEKSDFKIEGNGVEDIRKILINLIEGETNEI